GLAALVAYLASDMERPAYLMVGAVISTVAGTLLMGTVTGSLYRLSDHVVGLPATNPDLFYFVETWWPAVLLVAGFLPLAISLVADNPAKRARMVLMGAVPFLLGAFFLGMTLSVLH
ncbi:MAG: hypothetical protein QOH93_1658, partial [Chloroflexia bacterium]|nr:hypothetical protein [Chloroflexia bacterium]